MSSKILIRRDLLSQLLEVYWYSQWETRNAAENTVCSSGCGEPFEDFSGHAPACPFVAHWVELSEFRKDLGITYEVQIGRDKKI